VNLLTITFIYIESYSKGVESMKTKYRFMISSFAACAYMIWYLV